MGSFPSMRDLAATAVVAVGVFAVSATAGIHPTTLHIEVSDGFDSGVFLPAGTDEGGGVFNYLANGYNSGGEWDMDWDFNAVPFDPAFDSASINANFVVRNSSATETLGFRILVDMPLLGAATPEAYFGSAGITIANGTIATFGGDALFTALIDGAFLDDVFPDPYSLSGGTNDDSGVIAGAHNGANSSLSIALQFSLTPGADMTITSGFGILGASPAPSALALLGLGALGRRRRRN